VDIVDQIVERRIAEAIERGEFQDLPGEGRPIELDDDRLVPEELRVAYRILKNAGYIPEEVRLLAELRSAEQLLLQATAREERSAAAARLRLLLERLGTSRAAPLQSQSDYFQRLAERLAGARGG
jgi:ABC-type lipoprotein export system ATPase subunit